ncbi:glycerol-3-phosphate dehydrogenase [Tianweitania sediminis]|uniref:Glycerol-3-phosphate dehydrogenase n=1 Tax=Tianweitania sediminis TaxID=1502156 RepID=A0A8J7QVY6_9HYPH|nr:glycerol-3-phosphate dehydrogenase [Tianweitania sediminis]MBP0437072.1 glycerol-3-phosphate dehydrogenase [Tianweitania sediminis]
MHDILVVGGGINGCGIARDAAGRGYSVVLAEMKDLASGTSSWSTKLIHGGLRYLEHYEFRLVREALKEREVLWRNAPHIIWPMRFVLPYAQGLRAAWLIRLGLFLYDNIGGRKLLPATRTLDMRSDPAGLPLKPLFTRAFEYSDCWVDDARLVALNARDAADRGAEILTRTKLVQARRSGDHWRATLENTLSGERREVTARLIVNAAGPWVDHVLAEALEAHEKRHVRLVQGSHIVVRRKSDDPRAYFFQNRDNRIIFAIPYERDFTLIGTTDRDYRGEPGAAAITAEETDYLCAAASEYFREPVRREDIVWTYSGVRPLFDDGASKAQEATRDYVIKADGEPNKAPIVNIFGGKITTYRKLAESMMEQIEALIGRKGPAWTLAAALPGGDFPVEGFEAERTAVMRDYTFLSQEEAHRLLRLYGTRARAILRTANSAADLGQHFGHGLTEAEINYLIKEEWALTAEDVLWRRTKTGLHLNEEQALAVDAYMRRTAPPHQKAAE